MKEYKNIRKAKEKLKESKRNKIEEIKRENVMEEGYEQFKCDYLDKINACYKTLEKEVKRNMQAGDSMEDALYSAVKFGISQGWMIVPAEYYQRTVTVHRIIDTVYQGKE